MHENHIIKFWIFKSDVEKKITVKKYILQAISVKILKEKICILPSKSRRQYFVDCKYIHSDPGTPTMGIAGSNYSVVKGLKFV